MRRSVSKFLVIVYLLAGGQPVGAASESPSLSVQAIHDFYRNCEVLYRDRSSCPGLIAHPPLQHSLYYPPSTSIGYEALAVLANYLKSQRPVGADNLKTLWQVLSDPGTDPAQFLNRLDGWTMTQAQLRVLTNSALKRMSREWRVGGVPPNGVLTDFTYTTALENGYLPLIDDHDGLFHLPSLADPTFNLILKKHGKLVLAIASPFRDLTHFLTGGLRDYSVENWSYLTTDENGTPHLFVQGNRPFNGIVNFAIGAFSSSAISLRDIFFMQQEQPEGKLTGYRTLPHWRQFSRTPEARRILEKLKPWLAKAQPPTVEMMRVKRLIDQTIAQAKADFPTKTERTSNIGVVLDRLAMVAEVDPSLRAMMSYDTRANISLLLLELCEAYLAKYSDAAQSGL